MDDIGAYVFFFLILYLQNLPISNLPGAIFGTLEILAFQNKKLENNVLITNNDEIRIENTVIRYCTLL